MKRGTIILLAVLAVIVILAISLFSWYSKTYNGLVRMDENVNQSWAQVQNQYQRRMDLIPNLVEVVKGYAAHEKDVFTQVAEARSNAGKIQLTPEILNNPQLFQQFQQAQAGLSSALSRLLAVAEAYPQLKANENFLQLQAQLEGTENRISVERQRFNQAVQEFNTQIRVFPVNFVAGMMGFQQKQYFQSEPGAERAPKVKF